MTSSSWISCPMDWMLQDVQAGLNVIVTLLSFLASFILVQICWLRGAKLVAKGAVVPLHSLLVVTTPGEVYDVASLFRQRLFSRRYVRVLGQCLLIVTFSAITIFSGPIARFSSRQSADFVQQEVPGILVDSRDDSISNYNDRINTTFRKLEKAQFPTNQLLDFLPDETADWIFNPTEWNNSWTFNCQNTEATTVQVRTASCRTNCLSLDGLDPTWPCEDERSVAWTDYGYHSADGSLPFNVAMVAYTAKNSRQANVTNRVNMQLISGFLVVPGSSMSSNSSHCPFVPGHSMNVMYTKVACELRLADSQHHKHIAYPNFHNDDNAFDSLLDAFGKQFFLRWETEWSSNLPVTSVAPMDLIRFYQTYVIVKDTGAANRTGQIRLKRNLTVIPDITQVSIWFIVPACLIAALILLGSIEVAVFYVRYHRNISQTPKSRLQWMLQSIEAEDRPSATPETGTRKSVTVESMTDWAKLSLSERQQAEFEAAWYGGHETSIWFLKRNPTFQDSTFSLETHKDDDSAWSLSSTSVLETGRRIDSSDGKYV